MKYRELFEIEITPEFATQVAAQVVLYLKDKNITDDTKLRIARLSLESCETKAKQSTDRVERHQLSSAIAELKSMIYDLTQNRI